MTNPCSKNGYPTFDLAVSALLVALNKQMDGDWRRHERRIYLCPDCDRYHLTSKGGGSAAAAFAYYDQLEGIYVALRDLASSLEDVTLAGAASEADLGDLIDGGERLATAIRRLVETHYGPTSAP